ncbi:MAG TPA: hypothetical protein PLG15_00860 [Candidatus Gastranaerophilaceae bacterium]|nr:hypothetical protein [Candidatus Gastranaerophilaceae bacterium]HPT40916.1 hypothetical protein [Candidatus Gastranaerophilaceae bacterium]
MKKILALLIIGALVILTLSFDSAFAAKKGGKGKGLTQEDLDTMSASVDTLTKKIYANGLFSPTDNENLIDIKIKLDNQMLVSPDPSLAPLYYKVGVLYKSRQMKDEAVECFQTILENFADTALAPKATAQLKSMGVEVKAPEKKEGDAAE